MGRVKIESANTHDGNLYHVPCTIIEKTKVRSGENIMKIKIIISGLLLTMLLAVPALGQGGNENAVWNVYCTGDRSQCTVAKEPTGEFMFKVFGLVTWDEAQAWMASNINKPAVWNVYCTGDRSQCTVAKEPTGELMFNVFPGKVTWDEAQAWMALNINKPAVCNCTDDTPPQITCPANIQVQCPFEVPNADINSVTATDNCDEPVTITFVDTDNGGTGCPDNPLKISRTYTATDACGNSADCIQLIDVIDNTPPQITCPADIQVQCPFEVPNADINSVTATDNCDGPVTITFVDTDNGGTGCPNDPMIITRTYEATDACGNLAKCVQTITVIDDTPPEITCPDDIQVQCQFEVPAADINSVTATDNCDGPVEITFFDTPDEGTGCPDDPMIITRTYEATDACGNLAKCVQTITVIDDMPPQILGVDNQNFASKSDVPMPDITTVHAVDNCGGPVTVTFKMDLDYNYFEGLFVKTRVFEATDTCGNSVEAYQRITVEETDKSADASDESPGGSEEGGSDNPEESGGSSGCPGGNC